MSKSSEYVERYAEFAIEQQRKYGIPASVTLAQGILESANGQSQLSRECNNHFGIKAGKSWLDAGGQYGTYTDDKPNEKFCKYASVGDSYEHHSLILKNNSRYAACFSLPQDDYRGWCQGLQNAGYATSKGYASSLISVIDKMDLTKYDRMAAERGPIVDTQQNVATPNHDQSSHYSFPVKRDEFMLITSPYGMRNDPINKGQRQFHKGIDINCKADALLATEDNGKVLSVNQNANTGGGKSVTVEYDRPDGSKYQTTYMHMSDIDVKVGDIVNAGTKLGMSGNTGTRTTGEHLHFAVKQVSADGTKRDFDPAAYLAEIAAKGNIQVTAMHNGENLLAKYADQVQPTQDPSQTNDLADAQEMSPDDWMKKLLSSEDSGVHLPSNDPVMEMAITMFTSLMVLAVQIDGKDREEAMAMATDAAVNRQIDLSSLTPGLRSCVLSIQEQGNPILSVSANGVSFNHELTNAEMARLSNALNDSSLSAEEKQQRVAGVVNNIVVNNNMSQSFNQQVGNDQSQSIQR